MAEVNVKNFVMYDKDESVLWEMGKEIPTLTTLRSDDYIQTQEETDFMDSLGAKTTLETKLTRLSSWRILKMICDYDSLSWYYKFRIWLGFWLRIG